MTDTSEAAPMNWVAVANRLPRDRQAVLVRRNSDNWGTRHTLADGSSRETWRWVACQFIECRPEGNNLLPYIWREFGPGYLFGQEVSHWAAITDPVDIP